MSARGDRARPVPRSGGSRGMSSRKARHDVSSRAAALDRSSREGKRRGNPAREREDCFDSMATSQSGLLVTTKHDSWASGASCPRVFRVPASRAAERRGNSPDPRCGQAGCFASLVMTTCNSLAKTTTGSLAMTKTGPLAMTSGDPFAMTRGDSFATTKTSPHVMTKGGWS